MNELLPNSEIQESLRTLLNFVPGVLIILVVITVFAFEIVKLDGTYIKYYKIWVIAIALVMGLIAYLFYPVEQLKATDIPALIMSSIISLLIVVIIKNWRKNKTKRK